MIANDQLSSVLRGKAVAIKNLLLMGLIVGITGCGSDTTQVQPVVTFDHGSESNFAVAIRGLLTEDSRRLAATAGGSNVKLWDVETGEEELTLHGHEGRVIGLDFSPNGRLLASASLDNSVRLFDFFFRIGGA